MGHQVAVTKAGVAREELAYLGAMMPEASKTID